MLKKRPVHAAMRASKSNQSYANGNAKFTYHPPRTTEDPTHRKRTPSVLSR
jgi:hypothetical protein